VLVPEFKPSTAKKKMFQEGKERVLMMQGNGNSGTAATGAN
jgi:hypothetical protein